ncbi:WxL domain-containing protein [Lactiplantibacillus mudanjiangensis]|uniref:Cell surface protein [Lactobacillus pentosus] n=1 Tax=Lactiplantibacillus mudanjiangensis TaxID=1296538 RepID=A0A660DY31_9LACO|nr:WxL domain-containing protein [Lactiplantibacillus mudanjiangensis]VDG25554.1 cell surface protein [Lactobacillus pentosus] [Lactiplantibacillus mudanjiangensis]VDG28137.1 cell surface protein [Lactobacillus pentosus] [Lactiplantibacillus mudanjiangensis]
MKNVMMTSALILSLLGVPAMTANAAGSSATTGTDLELVENTDPTGPVNPDDPSKPQDPADPNNPVTGNEGPLSLDVAPESFNFGKVQIDSTEQTYHAKAVTGGTGKQYLQVTDSRGADQNGWTVTVEQDKDLTETTESNPFVLTGTTITVPAGTARNSLSDDPTMADDKLIATSAEVTNSSGAVAVLTTTSDAGAGKGTSVKTWDPTDVTLTIPKNTAKKGVYKNTLTWTLTAGVESTID